MYYKMKPSLGIITKLLVVATPVIATIYVYTSSAPYWTSNNADVTSESPTAISVTKNASKMEPAHLEIQFRELFEASNEIFKQGIANLIGLGCMKCGTSSIAGTIRARKTASYLPAMKELHFFDFFWNEQKFDEIGGNRDDYIKAYAQNWPASIPGQTVRFEKTPKYLYDFHAPWRMAILYGDLKKELKLFASLRDPADRAVSHYFHVGSYKSNPNTREELEAMLETDLLTAVRVLEKCYHMVSLSDIECPSYEEEKYRNENYYKCVSSTWGDRPSGIPFESVIKAIERGIYVDQLKRYLCAGFPSYVFMLLPFSKFTKLSEFQVLDILDSFIEGRNISIPMSVSDDSFRKVGAFTKGFALSGKSRTILSQFFDPWKIKLDNFVRENGMAHDLESLF